MSGRSESFHLVQPHRTGSAKSTSLERGAMGTSDLVFFVLGGVAPMGVIVALLPLSIALGNGAGVPGTYLIAGAVLALFAVGYVRMNRPRKPERDATLSDRERTVLRMLSGALSERDIGRELYLSHNTVHSHTRSIYRKLGVSSRAEAVDVARARRLI